MRGFLHLFVFLLCLAVPRVAWADELKDKAQELLSQGNALAAQGDFGLALVKFRTAYELYPSPKLLLNIGTSLRQVGRYAEAAETYERYLADPDANLDRAEELATILDELDALVGRLTIVVRDRDAKVSLDGEVLRDRDPDEALRVDPGPHTVVAEKQGFPPVVRTITVKAKERARVELSLTRRDEEEPPADLREVIGYTLVGIGSAGVLAGVILGWVALGSKGSANDLCDDSGQFSGYCSQEGSDLRKKARTEGVAATASFIAGFAVAGSGLALAISASFDDDEEAESEDTALSLEIGPGTLSLRGRW